MRITDAARRRRASPARGGWLLGPLLLMLVCGVVAMHSLGAGHTSAALSSSAHGPHALMAVSVDGSAGVDGNGDSGRHATPGHGSTPDMGMPCLAVLPLLLPLVALLTRLRTSWLTRATPAVDRRRRDRDPWSFRWRGPTPPSPGPSLSRLCISRT